MCEIVKRKFKFKIVPDSRPSLKKKIKKKIENILKQMKK